MTSNSLGIGRGWTVVTADGRRVGDVIEVHAHYLLVSRGVFRVRDMYLPLGAVDRTEQNTVILSVTYDVFRQMNLSHVPHAPEPVAAPEPLHDPAPVENGAAAVYVDGAPAAETTFESYAEPWDGTAIEQSYEFEESPSYAKPQPNGLVEVEPAVNLAFQDLGYGQTILLMPGWPFDGTVWEPLPALLAQDYRVVTYDPRGTGESDRPWEFYSIETLSQDLHRLIVEQSLHEVTIVAWSSAALAALTYARDHSQRVARLVLLNPLIPSWLADETLMAELELQPELDAQTQALWADDLLADRPAQHERLLDRLTISPLSEPRRRWLWQRLMHGAPHAQAKTWEELRQHDARPALGDVASPVTIISGAQDRLAPPALGAYLAAALPRAQHLVVEQCGHASFMEQRQAVLQAIADLLRIEEPAIEEAWEPPAAGPLADATLPPTPEEASAPIPQADEERATPGDAATLQERP